ncbi:hypothetical protein Tco_0714410 [Tanacetum coccineum]
MDDPNITMKEYIRLEEEKAQRHGRTFNWQTATYGKMEYYEDEDDNFMNFETEYPAIVFDDTLTSDAALSCEPTVSPLNKNTIDFRISFDESDDEDYMVIFDENSFSYKIISIGNLKMDSGNENDKVNMPSSPEPMISHSDDLDFFKDFENEFPAITYNDDLTSKLTEPSVNMEPLPPRDQRYTSGSDFAGLTEGMRQTLAGILRMIYTRDEGQELFTSHAWRRLFEIRAPLVWEFILEFLSTCRMSDKKMGLDVADTFCFQLGGARHRMTWRQFILTLGLHTDEEMAEDRFGAYWLGTEGRHLRRHAKGRKSGARLSGGYFIGRLAAHFRLVSDQGLRGLAMVTRELPLIDLHNLGRLNICERIDDTWAWVAPGPERQSDAATGVPGAAEDALVVDEGAQTDPPPVQAPQPSPPAPRTMPQRIARLEEEVQKLRWSIVGL